jgi:hypothetical protein
VKAGESTSEIKPARECATAAWNRAHKVGLVPPPASGGGLGRGCRDLLLFDLEDWREAGHRWEGRELGRVRWGLAVVDLAGVGVEDGGGGEDHLGLRRGLVGGYLHLGQLWFGWAGLVGGLGVRWRRGEDGVGMESAVVVDVEREELGRGHGVRRGEDEGEWERLWGIYSLNCACLTSAALIAKE